jgi:hypothetical protein
MCASGVCALDILWLFPLILQINSDIKTYVLPHADIAKKYNKTFMAYESGSDISGNSFALQANRDPGMYGLYKQYMNGLVAAGMNLFVHYSSITWYTAGQSFGLQEWMDQDPATAYKLNVGPISMA